MERVHSTSSAEKRWILWYALFVSLLTSLPYLLGILTAGEEWVFTGFVFGVEDGNSYIANMLSGAAGSWLFRTPYTTQLQNGALIFLHYITLGKLTFGINPHSQLLFLYHLFRIFSVFMVCLATYQFIGFFIPDVSLRRWGLALGTLGGGLGWLILLFGWGDWLAQLPLSDIPGLNMPLALYSPETFGFLALYGIPHVALARALLLWGLRYYLQLAAQDPAEPFPWLQGAKTGLIWLLVLLAQSLTGMVTGAAAGFYLVGLGIWQGLRQLTGRDTDWRRYWRIIRITLWVGIFALPLVLYYIILFQRDAVMRLWNLQSPLPSPNPVFYLFAYGLLIPFAIIGGLRLVRRKPWTGFLPVCWGAALPILVYAPFNMQRRLADGIWIALIVLALGSVSTTYISRDGESENNVLRRRKWFYILSASGFAAAFILIFGAVGAVLNPGPPLFLSVDQVRAYGKLGYAVEPGDVVLSSYETGNPLPAFVPVRVVTGIETLTVSYDEIESQVRSFYQVGASDEYRQELLLGWGVDYVYWGPQEQLLGGWNPNQAAFLERIITVGEHKIFRVNNQD